MTATVDVPGGIGKNEYAVKVEELVDSAVLNVSVTDVAAAECETTYDPSVADTAVLDVLAQVITGQAIVVPALTTVMLPVPDLLNVEDVSKYLYGSSAIKLTCTLVEYPLSEMPATEALSTTNLGIAAGLTIMYKL